MSTRATASQRQPTFLSTVRLVAQREMRTRLRSKGYRWMFAGLLMAAALGTVLPNVIGGADPVPVAVVGQAPAGLEELEDGGGTDFFDVREQTDDRAAADRMLRDGDIDAVLVFGGDAHATVVGLREAPQRAVQALSVAPAVELLDPSSRDPSVMYFVTLAFGILFFLAASVFGTQIAQSVVEEKSTRIVEILLTAMSARALLTGKVLGNSALAILQIVGMAAVALAGLAATGGTISLDDLSAAILWFVVFFAFGFVMVASLFAATASLVSRAEDIGSATTPVTTLIMIPYLLSFVSVGNETLTRVLAWIPFSSPISMPALIFSGDALWWEPIGALLILVVTTVLAIALGERIYSNSLLRTGARVRWREAIGR